MGHQTNEPIPMAEDINFLTCVVVICHHSRPQPTSWEIWVKEMARVAELISNKTIRRIQFCLTMKFRFFSLFHTMILPGI